MSNDAESPADGSRGRWATPFQTRRNGGEYVWTCHLRLGVDLSARERRAGLVEQLFADQREELERLKELHDRVADVLAKPEPPDHGRAEIDHV